MRPSVFFLIIDRVCNTSWLCRNKLSILFILVATLPLASATSSDKPDLLARNACTSSGGWVTDVLVVTTSVRVLDWVHGTPTNLWPAVALHPVLVVGTTSLQHRLVEATATSHDTDGGTAGLLHPLLGARRQMDLGTGLLHIVSDDGAVVARAASNHTTVTRAGLDVADDSTLRHRHDWESVANDELGLLAAVDELPGVAALHSWEQLLLELVCASIVKVSLDQRCATARIVDDVLHDTLHETIALAVVEHTKLGSSLAAPVVGLEDGTTALTLTTDDTTHPIR